MNDDPAKATRELAAFAADLDFADVPPDVVVAAKTILLDGFATMVAGSVQPAAVPVRAWRNAKGGVPDSSVVGQPTALPAADAAFLNGFFGHCLDYEVQGLPSAHGTSSILPGPLAVGERDRRTGQELITAFVVGWDVQQRLRTAGAEAPLLKVFHPPGVVGPMGAVAASGNMQALTPDQMAIAFGLAASRAGGLFANNGTMAKALHPAGAARAGVESVELALAGLTANTDILGDRRGYVSAFFTPDHGHPFDWSIVTENLGTHFHLTEPGFNIKAFPAEIFMQWPIEAARQVRLTTSGFDPVDIEAVVIEPPVFRADLSRPAPVSGLDGKFSYEYCVAVALTQPEVVIDSFSDEIRFSVAIEQILPRISVVENRQIPADKTKTYSTVSVTLRDGSTSTRTCRAFPGSVANPMARSARLAKVADCLAVGGFADRFDGLVCAVESLEDVEDIGGLMSLVTASREISGAQQ